MNAEIVKQKVVGCSVCGCASHKKWTCPNVPGHEGAHRCAACKEWKPITEYNLKNKTTGELQRLCKTCMLPYRRKWYRKHHEEQVARTLQNRLNRRELFRAFKSQPCMDCGQSYHWFVMDFDHRGDKTMNLSKMVQSGASWARILEEIAKCDLVCANCHRMRTWEQMPEIEEARRQKIVDGHARRRANLPKVVS